MAHGPPTKPKPDVARAAVALGKIAASFPDVTLDHPWGHEAYKIRGKVFLFLGADADGVGLSMKLPVSGALALELPFAQPTRYGLGKSGWVSARFKTGKDVPLGLMKEWIAESYEAIAPKSRRKAPSAKGSRPIAEKPPAKNARKRSTKRTS